MKNNHIAKFFSVIIPVYNAEHFIEKCVKSILFYDAEDLEVLLVDDGSKDNSLQICHRLQQEDPRVVVIAKENQGVSAARNVGLERAKGKFVLFADADDYYEQNTFVFLKQMLMQQDSECMMFCYQHCFTNGKKTKNGFTKPAGIYLISEIAKQYWYLYNSGMMNPVWNKVYKNDILQKAKIRFDPQIVFAEDAIFNVEYLSHCKDVKIIENILYNYVHHTEQATAKQHKQFFKMEDKCFEKIECFIIRYTLLGSDHYSEWLKVILQTCYHQNFKLPNVKEIEQNERTQKMCKKAKPVGLQQKICFWLIRHGHAIWVAKVCEIRHGYGKLKKAIIRR